VADDLRVNSWLVVPAGELHERFSRSSGPGGQGVNTADTRVELSFDIARSPALPEYARVRALDNLRGRASEDGVLTVVSSEQRSQLLNRRAARGRMANLIREAIAPPPAPRVATRPSRRAKERRVADKRRRSEVKRNRQVRPGDE
jgi:ribosome-associated protein